MVSRVLLCFLAATTLFLGVSADKIKSGFGPEKVFQQSGHLTIPGYRGTHTSQMFFWFFESRQSPETAPLMIFLNGGPGCSSMIGLTENGPYILHSDMNLTLNPYSWNSIANVIWLDQPVGTGFSYSDSLSDYTTTEEQVAIDLYQFMQIFLEQYPKYANLPFFIAGESYAGKFNPHFANYIVRKNQEGRNPKINLQGVALGNAMVNPAVQMGLYADFLYSRGMLTELQREHYNNFTFPTCKAAIEYSIFPNAMTFCQEAMINALGMAEVTMGRSINAYDITKKCDHPPLCYNNTLDAAKFFNLPNVQRALGAKPGITWSGCVPGPNLAMVGDWTISYAQDLPPVLATGVRVMAYSGAEDYVCNTMGGKAWMDQMVWPSQQGFNSAPMTPWITNQQQVGQTKSYNGFTWVEINHAGHLAPSDQPAATLDMIKRFIFNKPFSNSS
jgi:carboxypeptidase C (cathepsin A)